ncbi:hypothetical protein BC829DRAFT_386178 [Chytridium lagenaria]|nr:hypothetical protein BC829DRAFT_386178 [Chytridium lagenaria]
MRQCRVQLPPLNMHHRTDTNDNPTLTFLSYAHLLFTYLCSEHFAVLLSPFRHFFRDDHVFLFLFSSPMFFLAIIDFR